MQTDSSVIQTTYDDRGELPRLGMPWRGRIYLADYDSACVDRRKDKAGVWELVVTNNVNAESWAVVVDGAYSPFTTGATPTATSNAVKAAIDAAKAPGKFLEPIVATAVVDVAKTTVTQKDYATHEFSIVSLAGGQTSTFTSTNTIAASKRAKHKAGYFVTLDKPNGGPECTAVRPLTSTADEVYGVVSGEGAYPKDEYGLVGDETVPENRSFSVARREEIMVPCATDVAYDDPVYAVCVGVDAGKATNTQGGTGEVHTITLAGFSAADVVGGSFDGLAPVTLVSGGGVEATDAGLLAAKFAANPDYAARFTFQAVGVTVVATAKDRTTHLFTDASTGGTATDVVTALTPATARLVPGSKFKLSGKTGERTPIDLAVR